MPIRVQSPTTLPAGNTMNIMQAEQTYGLMMHISQALGVNCTHCHGTQNFGEWAGTPPQRVQGWHAIQMVRTMNNTYMLPLQGVLPANRMGPLGDVPKIHLHDVPPGPAQAAQRREHDGRSAGADAHQAATAPPVDPAAPADAAAVPVAAATPVAPAVAGAM